MKIHKIIVAFTVQIRNQKFCRCSIQKVVLVADKILKFTWNEYSGKYFLVLQGFMVLGPIFRQIVGSSFCPILNFLKHTCVIYRWIANYLEITNSGLSCPKINYMKNQLDWPIRCKPSEICNFFSIYLMIVGSHIILIHILKWT